MSKLLSIITVNPRQCGDRLKSLADWLFSTSVTYEDVDQWFKERKGYVHNLSEDEKEKFFAKDENLPLGL